MTEDRVRTYTVGEAPDEYVWRPNTGTWCNHRINGYICSIEQGHAGPQHVAANEMRIVAVVDRDQADDVAVTPMTEVPIDVDALRREIETLRAELERTREALLTERRVAQNRAVELERFKENVVQVGGEYAERHDMCSVYDDLMEELGLPRRQVTYDVDIEIVAKRTITLQVTTNSGADSDDIRAMLGWSEIDEAFREQESEEGWESTDWSVSSHEEA